MSEDDIIDKVEKGLWIAIEKQDAYCGYGSDSGIVCRTC